MIKNVSGLRTRIEGSIRFDMLQNPSELKATFREKTIKQHFVGW